MNSNFSEIVSLIREYIHTELISVDDMFLITLIQNLYRLSFHSFVSLELLENLSLTIFNKTGTRIKVGASMSDTFEGWLSIVKDGLNDGIFSILKESISLQKTFVDPQNDSIDKWLDNARSISFCVLCKSQFVNDLNNLIECLSGFEDDDFLEEFYLEVGCTHSSSLIVDLKRNESLKETKSVLKDKEQVSLPRYV